MNRRRRCKGWISLRGIIARCSEPVARNRNNSLKYHSAECRRFKERLREKGLSLGDPIAIQPRPCKGWVIRDGHVRICGGLFTPKRRSTASMHGECARLRAELKRREFAVDDPYRPKVTEKIPEPKACKGWVVRNGVVDKCGELFTRKRQTATGHAQCVEKRRYLQGQGFSLGDPYPRKRKSSALGRCKGWVVRNGIIEECGQSRQELEPHKACYMHKTQWTDVGYQLGESVLRKCSYRRCFNPPFVRTKKSTSGDYYCCASHGTLETLARKEDRMAAKVAELETKIGEAALKPKGKPGRPGGHGKIMETRIELAAAFLKLHFNERGMSSFVYRDTPTSAYSNTRNLFSDHRDKITSKAAHMSLSQAHEMALAVGANLHSAP